jgi:mannose-6-phosphate isomerase
MLQPIFLTPVFKERIWGGTLLKQEFGYNIPSDKTGECWAISAHPNGSSIVANGEFIGKSLAELWKEQPQLFGNPSSDVFPLLTKILDANMDLSVQVHPDDSYANSHENGELGKTECWYILDCKKDAEMILGHHAKTREELEKCIEDGAWDDLLRKVKIKPGDFFYVPSGTIHALCEGTLVLETQQSSDTTYRVYDYDRRDEAGNLRELHLEKAIDVTTVPHQDPDVCPKVTIKDQAVVTTFVETEFFSVHKWDIHGQASFSSEDRYLLVSIIEGTGRLTYQGERYSLEKGAHLLIPVGFNDFNIEGQCQLIVSHP